MKYLALGQRLKQFREKAGLSQEELASKVKMELAEIQQIETQTIAPKIAQLIRFAKALQINVADIFRDRPQKAKFEILRRNERQKISPLLEPNSQSRIHDYSYEMLTLPSDSKHLDAYLIEIPPRQGKKPHENLTHPGEEFIYLLQGGIRGHVAGEEIELQEGDAMYFQSSTPHSFYNPFEVKAIAISIIYPF